MRYVLNVIYVGLLVACSPWLLWSAIRKGKYRDGLSQKLLGRVPVRTGNAACAWFHAVSVGEVNALSTILPQFERDHPGWECVVSATTRTGYELATKKYAPRTVFYCPLDFSWSVTTALRRVRPKMLVLTELELWPNLIAISNTRQVRLAIVNGRLSEKSAAGYGKVRPLIRRALQRFELIGVQTETYATRFRALGADASSVHVTGSVKFDGAETDRQNARTVQLRHLACLEDNDCVILAGSTSAPEEDIVLNAYRALDDCTPRPKLIIVPRHPERFDEVAGMLENTDYCWCRRSELERRSRSEPSPDILLVDAIGELGAWWGVADIGYVGGSMGSRGGQNMIEPAAYGVAISFGPNTQNFRDVVAMLLAENAACVVHDKSDLEAFFRNCLQDGQWRRNIGNMAQSVVLAQKGATEKTVALLSANR